MMKRWLPTSRRAVSRQQFAEGGLLTASDLGTGIVTKQPFKAAVGLCQCDDLRERDGLAASRRPERALTHRLGRQPQPRQQFPADSQNRQPRQCRRQFSPIMEMQSVTGLGAGRPCSFQCRTSDHSAANIIGRMANSVGMSNVRLKTRSSARSQSRCSSTNKLRRRISGLTVKPLAVTNTVVTLSPGHSFGNAKFAV